MIKFISNAGIWLDVLLGAVIVIAILGTGYVGYVKLNAAATTEQVK